MHVMTRAFAARALAFPVSTVASLGTTALVIRTTGAEVYAAIMLGGTIFTLMPFADLGAGALIVNTFARPRSPRAGRRGVSPRVFRLLLMSALVVGVIGWLGTSAWSWASLLGMPGSGHVVDLATAWVVTLFALSIPLSIGNRMLVGSGRAAVAILLAPVGSIVALLLSWLISSVGRGPAGWQLVCAGLRASCGTSRERSWPAGLSASFGFPSSRGAFYLCADVSNHGYITIRDELSSNYPIALIDRC